MESETFPVSFSPFLGQAKEVRHQLVDPSIQFNSQGSVWVAKLFTRFCHNLHKISNFCPLIMRQDFQKLKYMGLCISQSQESNLPFFFHSNNNHNVLPMCVKGILKEPFSFSFCKKINSNFHQFFPKLYSSRYLAEQNLISCIPSVYPCYMDQDQMSKSPKCSFECTRYALKFKVQDSDAIFTIDMTLSSLQLNFLLKRVLLINQ